MDEEETKNCPNCKRDIPAVNFTIHSVHCARNIRVCPACKVPVPSSELAEHHQKFHKLLPCKQCGESVCGTDLEDHIRDSCANTKKICRYCELELPRSEMPAHEGYCGARTEQCPDCKEFVIIKYKQLHLDSNHRFMKLDDEPNQETNKLPKLNIIRPAWPALPNATASAFVAVSNNYLANWPTTSFGAPSNIDSSDARALPFSNEAPVRPTSIFDDAAPANFRNEYSRSQRRHADSSNNGSSASSAIGGSPQDSGSRPATVSNGVKKRTNDQPQINTHKEPPNKVHKDMATSRGAVKKRLAPKPPRSAPADPRRDMTYYSAMQRQQREERERREQNEYNLANGLPPVLSPAAKLEKLRKMDALHNREVEKEYSDRVRRLSPELREDEGRRLQEFKNLKPMSPEQFMVRFSELQVRGDGDGDRFREIKSSLQELRRGLNEVTAPYNNNNVNANNNESENADGPREELRLPCEFCNVLVPADDLVQHQTGCRPDLAQWWGGRVQTPPCVRSPSPSPVDRATHLPPADPVIPCEFCAQSLPVYLITEHQERCAREVDILAAD